MDKKIKKGNTVTMKLIPCLEFIVLKVYSDGIACTGKDNEYENQVLSMSFNDIGTIENTITKTNMRIK